MRLLLLIPFIFALKAFAAEKCADRLSKLSSQPSFIGYMQRLLDNRIIGEKEMQRLIEAGRVVNPILKEETIVDSHRWVHREGLERIILRSKPNFAEVVDWARRNLKDREDVRVNRENTRVKTQGTNVQMVFHRIDPAKIVKSNLEGLQPVAPFELMATPVTQRHFSLVAEGNTSHFSDGEHSVKLRIAGKRIEMQPDHPVENLDWNVVVFYIRRLNELSAENDPRLYQLIGDHQRGDRYRLPLEHEWAFVIGYRESPEGVYNLLVDRLEDYAWFNKEATQPVAELKPIIIDGKEFFDMFGNVSELVQSSEDATVRKIRGGSWASTPSDLYEIRRPILTDSSSIGFRLVRERGAK